MKISLNVLLIFLIFVAGFYSSKYFKTDLPVLDNKSKPKIISNVPTLNLKRENFLVKAVQKASPSVVFIGVTQIKYYQRSLFSDPFFQQFFPPSITSKKFKSMGSGVIIRKDGYIVTNFHVIGENASKIEVHLQNGKKYSAKLLGADPFTDLAVIKINGKNFPFIDMCSNDSLYIGEWAIAIGNPFGALIEDNKPTVTVGVIGATHREFKKSSGIKYKNMIQTDASINPGNSGGALINCFGKLIGINTFIFSQNNSGSVGVGFAIPVSRVKKTVKEVIKYGKIRSFYTGISIQDITPAMAHSLGFASNNGVIINSIDKHSPGLRAGLKLGDIITKVNRYNVFSSSGISDIFNQYLVGDRLTIIVLRDKKRLRLNLTLSSKPSKY